MASISDDRFFFLPGGVVIPTPTIRLAWSLENRGWRLLREGERLRVADPASPDGKPALSEADIEQIRQHKAHLLRLVDYCAERTTS